jgi:hypothetical protein
MQNKYIYISLLALILLSSFMLIQNSEGTQNFTLETSQIEFEAGSPIVLKFSPSGETAPLLYCSSSYGSTLIVPTYNSKFLMYNIPFSISSKIGVVNWKLIYEGSLMSGKLQIRSKKEVLSMETYIGPPSIEAGGTDYTMLVVIPTDSLDNPFPDNTLVLAKHQFLNSEENEVIFTEDLISYKNIYSQKESGRIFVSSESLGTNSKEFSVTVFPAIPIDFKISAARPHGYADGNQVTTFTTSVIVDKHNNIVADATYVTFFITNEKGNILKSSGATINGVATSKMIHPDYETQWSVKAYVDGMAESELIILKYKQVIKSFEVAFSENNRDITVGPLQSFMKQIIPDGIKVTLLIYKYNRLFKTETKTSFEGLVNFNLKSYIYNNDDYTIIVKTAGLEKTFHSKRLW